MHRCVQRVWGGKSGESRQSGRRVGDAIHGESDIVLYNENSSDLFMHMISSTCNSQGVLLVKASLK